MKERQPPQRGKLEKFGNANWKTGLVMTAIGILGISDLLTKLGVFNIMQGIAMEQGGKRWREGKMRKLQLKTA